MNLLQCLEVHPEEISEIYASSYTKLENGELAMVRTGTELRAAVCGPVRAQFTGAAGEDYLLCPTNHENRLALNAVLPYTAPTAFGRAGSSFGFGDRLGFANAAQVRSIAKTPVRPVLAQQSLRELQLTGRTLTEVIDCAAWAVFREGYREGYACDGDHLKTLDEALAAVAEGCTMITLDCSLVLKHVEKSEREWQAAFDQLPADRRKLDEELYLSGHEPAGLGLRYSKAVMAKLHTVYDAALELIRDVYVNALVPAGRPMDFEVSLDETVETTTPEAHYFVAVEMERMGVTATSIAPKFVGEFQKAIDYIGDLRELRATMAVHAKIADRFGYKLSLHSASEKFSALPIIAEATGGRYHIKTSGTSWLEVVEVISKTDPALYRRMHEAALAEIEEAKHFYVVHCDLRKVAPLDTVSDGELPNYLLQNDARQLMHITYGGILRRSELKKAILDFLKENRRLYEAEAEELYDRHFAALHVHTENSEKGGINA